MRFLYLRDPLFLASLGIYFVNRWLIKPNCDFAFFHAHLNDCICLAFWVPVSLCLSKTFGLRNHDLPPQPHEIIISLLIWSLTFEVLLPQHPFFGKYSVGDHLDIACYCAGALGAAWCWRTWYQAKPRSQFPSVGWRDMPTSCQVSPDAMERDTRSGMDK